MVEVVTRIGINEWEIHLWREILGTPERVDREQQRALETEIAHLENPVTQHDLGFDIVTQVHNNNIDNRASAPVPDWLPRER